jgi:Ca2+-dependent lipid-binding protein
MSSSTLPLSRNSSTKLPLASTVHVKLFEAKGLRSADSNGLSDPYVVVGIVDKEGKFERKGKTQTIKKELNPHWDQSVFISLDNAAVKSAAAIRVEVYDEDMVGSDFLGEYFWPLDYDSWSEQRTVQLQERKGRKEGITGTLTARIEYTNFF